LGIYYHCSDLYFAFPYLKDKPSQANRRLIIHYFNLGILYEVLDTLIVTEDYLLGVKGSYNLDELQNYLEKWIPSYKKAPLGMTILHQLLSFVALKREQIKTWLERGKPKPSPKPFLPLDFISNLCSLLQEIIPWMKERPIYFFLDDYSLPRISKPIQVTLHDFILHRYSKCFFKISTESITTFHPYDSRGKLIEETREYDIIDLGAYFLHSSKEVKKKFLAGVVNTRLINTIGIHRNYQDIAKILGNSGRSFNKLAIEIRKAKAGKRVYYYGWDIVVELCSGDVVNTLRLIRDIISLVGGIKKFGEPDKIKLPLNKENRINNKGGDRWQDQAIREIGNDFLNRVEAVPNVGKDLRKIAEAFGEVANWYLRNKNSKNQTRNPPWQAFRMEIRDTPYFEDSLLQKAKEKYDLDKTVKAEELASLYKSLIKYGIFLRDIRGKSQRGAVIPRLYLRRLLIPTFLLTPNRRDNIGVELGEFFMLLSSPDMFISHMKMKKPQRREDKQRKLFNE